MHSKEYLEYRDEMRIQIQQGLASTTDILEAMNKAFDLGELEGLHQIETRLKPEDMQAFMDAISESRFNILEEYISNCNSKQYSMPYLRKSWYHKSICLYERYYPGIEVDWTILVKDLTPEEIEFCEAKGVRNFDTF
jgi:hypothetical protein